MNLPRIWMILLILVLIVIIFVCGGFVFSSISAHPQPEYAVDSLKSLQEKMAESEESYLLPDADLLDTANASYTVYLKDRFHDDPSGYQISTPKLSVHCRLIDDYPGDTQLRTDRECEGISVELSQWETQCCVRFLLGDCVYEIISDQEQVAMEIAKSIICVAS